ncbi:MAG: ABC-F family ATP-binding cassette domain-containing protein [Anaerolineaceae bacterium]|nr:ABC-F family ATP-binding cassette domain-containing protein [Anaerolineaceae bacterium]MBN2677324.1 ABC-F family ATP-binding cassette domain-containing protein [Anaerolineaceae bacterium]
MLTAHHITKSYGIQPILEDISISISDNDRIGLIGPNGCGKTTLLRILAGEDKPDAGTVTHTRPGLRVGYMQQGLALSDDLTIATLLDIPAENDDASEDEVATLAVELSRNPDDAQLQARYDAALIRLSSSQVQPESILAPLGLTGLSYDTPVRHLSGGQKTRLSLAKILLADPHLLLLDEPTNHLDIAMLEWLEGWLQAFNGAVLIVSHDRALLDNSTRSILELDPSTHAIRAYPGNYTDYVEQKLSEREHQAHAWQDQQEEIAQLKAAAAHLRGLTRFKKGGKADSGDKFARGFFMGRATKGVAGRAKHIEARIEKLLNEQKVERPKPSWQLKLDFGAPEHLSRDVVIAKNLSIGYTKDRALLTGLNLHVRAGQRIALTGENGSGKTSLIRTIMGAIPPLDGDLRVGEKVRPGCMAQEQELLDPKLSGLATIQKEAPFNETEARHFLHFFLFSGDDPLRPSGSYSYGERARLMLALLVAGGCTFLVLDEPINHLDIPSRARFEQALGNFKGAVLAVVHDRWFIQNFAEEVWVIENRELRKY